MLAAVTRETAVARSLDFVEIQNNEATTEVASIEDAAQCGERADALVSGMLARVMSQRRTVATAMDYVGALSRETRANARDLVGAENPVILPDLDVRLHSPHAEGSSAGLVRRRGGGRDGW
jgi:hypothetical protein